MERMCCRQLCVQRNTNRNYEAVDRQGKEERHIGRIIGDLQCERWVQSEKRAKFLAKPCGLSFLADSCLSERMEYYSSRNCVWWIIYFASHMIYYHQMSSRIGRGLLWSFHFLVIPGAGSRGALATYLFSSVFCFWVGHRKIEVFSERSVVGVDMYLDG